MARIIFDYLKKIIIASVCNDGLYGRGKRENRTLHWRKPFLFFKVNSIGSKKQGAAKSGAPGQSSLSHAPPGHVLCLPFRKYIRQQASRLNNNWNYFFISKIIYSILLWLLFFSGSAVSPSFEKFIARFCQEYIQLNIPELDYDYRYYYSSIPSSENLKTQEEFFKEMKVELSGFRRDRLSMYEKIIYDHLVYEIELNHRRIVLENKWVSEGRIIPAGGLHSLPDYKAWYSYFIAKFTSLDLQPDEIFNLGIEEIKRVKDEINRIRITAGFSDSLKFYEFLLGDEFYITTKDELLTLFAGADSVILANLFSFTGDVKLPKISAMEWSGAGPNTPPGIYLNHTYNAYGKDVFQYNFYGGRFNRRAVEWIYIHEAIPGHHLQYSIRNEQKVDSLQKLFTYPGNFEGWACYVEYEGKKLGAYKDIYSELGKWEWDLVRSARLVIDAGIHYYGWSREEALAFWRNNIPGQDDIADREVTRVTNWVGQALSYKAGAKFIQDLKAGQILKLGNKYDESKFHRNFLDFGMRPLEVIRRNFL